jgi:hypothetical protein
MFRPFAGIQCALLMMLSPRQHIERIVHMADLRTQLQTVQSLWPVSETIMLESLESKRIIDL